MLTFIIDIITKIVLIFVVVYIWLKPLSWLVTKFSKKTTSQKVVKIEEQINKITKKVKTIVIKTWLVLIAMCILKAMPKIIKGIKKITKNLGDKMDIINGIHAVMQGVLILVILISVVSVIFLLKVKVQESKKAKSEDTSNNY